MHCRDGGAAYPHKQERECQAEGGAKAQHAPALCEEPKRRPPPGMPPKAPACRADTSRWLAEHGRCASWHTMLLSPLLLTSVDSVTLAALGFWLAPWVATMTATPSGMPTPRLTMQLGWSISSMALQVNFNRFNSIRTKQVQRMGGPGWIAVLRQPGMPRAHR